MHLIVFTVLRLGFFVYFAADGDFPFSDLIQAFYLGARFDLRLSLLLTLPLLIFAWKGLSPLASNLARNIWSLIYTLFAHVWLLFYFFDFGYYGYLGSRINMSILSFLSNPDIAFGMMWDSYPLVWIMLGFYLLLIAYFFIAKMWLFSPLQSPWQPKWVRWGKPIAFACLFVVGVHGRVGQYPLRWSEAFFSPHHFLSHLALNPLLYFIDTADFTQQKGYDVQKTKQVYPIISDYLKISQPDPEKLNFIRKVKALQNKNYNVVVIVMESLALSKTNLMDNPLNPTPYLEQIALDNYWFSNYYSPTEGTARNMFGIMTAIPDVTKVETSTRNPFVVDQNLIINAFKNYKKYYFLGGSASWANIRGIFSHNIKDINIIEEGSFEKSTMDVWGISDLDLFIEAHKTFKKWKPSDKPFVAMIQAASFHRPYDIPADAKGFKKEKHDLEKLKEAGFYSIEQYNSLKFTDYSLGYFFQLAKNSKYYENTIFVITGDHGLPSDKGKNVSPGRDQLNLEKFHVPLVFVNKHIFPEAKKDERPAGHMDIMTTIASLVGVNHENTTLGRNLFDQRYDNERYAFMYNYYSEVGEYGLVNGELYYRFDDVKKGQLYQFDSVDPLKDVKEEYPDEYLRMQAVAEAIYESSRYLLYHNQKERPKTHSSL